jgi:hypothetical protein
MGAARNYHRMALECLELAQAAPGPGLRFSGSKAGLPADCGAMAHARRAPRPYRADRSVSGHIAGLDPAAPDPRSRAQLERSPPTSHQRRSENAPARCERIDRTCFTDFLRAMEPTRRPGVVRKPDGPFPLPQRPTCLQEQNPGLDEAGVLVGTRTARNGTWRGRELKRDGPIRRRADRRGIRRARERISSRPGRRDGRAPPSFAPARAW